MVSIRHHVLYYKLPHNYCTWLLNNIKHVCVPCFLTFTIRWSCHEIQKHNSQKFQRKKENCSLHNWHPPRIENVHSHWPNLRIPESHKKELILRRWSQGLQCLHYMWLVVIPCHWCHGSTDRAAIDLGQYCWIHGSFDARHIKTTSRQAISTSQSLGDHFSLTLQLAMDITAIVTLPNN